LLLDPAFLNVLVFCYPQGSDEPAPVEPLDGVPAVALPVAPLSDVPAAAPIKDWHTMMDVFVNVHTTPAEDEELFKFIKTNGFCQDPIELWNVALLWMNCTDPNTFAKLYKTLVGTRNTKGVLGILKSFSPRRKAARANKIFRKRMSFWLLFGTDGKLYPTRRRPPKKLWRSLWMTSCT
jgi:hypothetical protein